SSATSDPDFSFNTVQDVFRFGTSLPAPFDVIASATPTASADNFVQHDATASTAQLNAAGTDPTSFVIAGPETVTLSGSGLTFINTYGSGVNDAYHTAIIAAENFFQSHFTNSVTLRMNFDLQSL